MKLLKKISCFIVATCMAISCVACSGDDTTWAFEYGDTTIGSGLYIAMSISAYMQASYSVTDYTQSVLTQYVDGQPAKEWIVNKTAELANRYAYVESEFDRLGLELSEEDVTAIDEELRALWNSAGDIYEANGVSRNSYRLIIESTKKENAIFQAYYGKGGTDEVSDSDLFDYFESEYAIINAMSIQKEFVFSEDALSGIFDDEETDEDDDEDADDSEDDDEDDDDTTSGASPADEPFERAVLYVDRINGGETFNYLVAEYTAELEAEAALLEEEADGEEGTVFDIEYVDAEDAEEFKANLENSINENEASLLDEPEEELEEDELDEEEIELDLGEILEDSETKFAIARSSTQPSAEFVNQLFQMPKNGTAELIEDTTAYYVIVRYEVEEDDTSYLDMKESLLYTIKDGEFGEIMEEYAAEYAPTLTNNASITRYDPKNISL